MNKLPFFILIIGSTILYIFLINLIVIFLPFFSLNFNSTINQTFIINSGIDTQVGMGESIAIGVKRDPKWYGLIIEEGDGMEVRQSNFYLFNLIKIPLRTNEINFRYFHSIFLFVVAIAIIYLVCSFFIEIERGYD